MRKLLAFIVLLIPFFSIDAMVKTGVEVGIGPDEEVIQEVWVGPGYYYGYWFDDEAAYYRWVRVNRHYYGGVVQEVWVGPGYYYGYWFGNEHAYHRWYRGHHRHHGHHHGGRHGGHRGGHHGGHHGGRHH